MAGSSPGMTSGFGETSNYFARTPISFQQPHCLQIRLRALATRCARAVHLTFAPEKMEGVGNAGCPLHPQPRARFVVVEAHE
jgi:hypothetical protein